MKIINIGDTNTEEFFKKFRITSQKLAIEYDIKSESSLADYIDFYVKNHKTNGEKLVALKEFLSENHPEFLNQFMKLMILI